MSSTNKTTHYDLPQWIGTDKPTFLGDLNGAYQKIDSELYKANSTATNASGVANQASSEVASLASQVQTNTTAIQTQGLALTTVTNLANTTEKKLNSYTEVTSSLPVMEIGTYLESFSPTVTRNLVKFAKVEIGGVKFLSIYGSFVITYVGEPTVADVIAFSKLKFTSEFINYVTVNGKRTFYKIGAFRYEQKGIGTVSMDLNFETDNGLSRTESIPTGTLIRPDYNIAFDFQAMLLLG